MKTLLLFAMGLSLETCFLVLQPSTAHNLASQKPTISVPSESLGAGGNEPFWDITISKNGIVYTSLGMKKLTFPYVAPMKAEGRPANNVRVYRLQGKPSGMLIINKVSACSDTMSDKQHAYAATLILGNNVREGCADK